MNAVLQALLNLRSFTADMESNTLRAEDFPSSSALRQLFKIMLEAKNEESNAIIDPTTFKLSIESTSAIFMGFFQQVLKVITRFKSPHQNNYFCS